MSYPKLPSKPIQEPAWQSTNLFTAADLPQRNRYWLLDDGSLTSRLVRISNGAFQVQRLFQCWEVPRPSECQLLGLPSRERALVREVVLLSKERPVVFARSVFPISCLTGNLNHLKRLQSKPLGAILFKHPRMHRSPFELAHMAGDADYLPSALHQGEPAWGRRSRFTIDGKSLMVSEVFLQDFSPWPKMAPVHRSQRGRVNAAKTRPKQ